ncbi:MAG: DUF87 domain-containing protein [Sulfolobales archaeon]|nr:DUF87 domain-containing protein [Sulfolobales archaeon]MDW8086116.1 DUF87 domain-containing protein [Ignisphaera sp.]
MYVNPALYLFTWAQNVDGVYIGMDLDFGSKVYWDPSSAITSHVFVVGPSGSGKSVALSTLSYRMVRKFKSKITVFDVKTEYYHLFKVNGMNLNVFNPLKTPLPLCFCEDNRTEFEQKVNEFLNVFSKVYGISTTMYRTLYECVKYVCGKCESIEHLYDTIENLEALNDIAKIFEIYPTKDSDPMKSILNANTIIELKDVFLKSSTLSSFVIYYVVDSILRNCGLSFSGIPQRIIVVDELWHAAPHIMDGLTQILTRYSRGCGISFFMATQSIDDVGMHVDAVTNSSAVLLAMASQSHGYWNRMARYLNLSRRGIYRAAKLSGQGECVARVYPYENPVFIYIDPLEN